MKTSDFDEQGGDLPHLVYFVQQEKEEVMLKKKESCLFGICSFLTFATSQSNRNHQYYIRHLLWGEIYPYFIKIVTRYCICIWKELSYFQPENSYFTLFSPPITSAQGLTQWRNSFPEQYNQILLFCYLTTWPTPQFAIWPTDHLCGQDIHSIWPPFLSGSTCEWVCNNTSP